MKYEIPKEDVKAILESLVEAKLYHGEVLNRIKASFEDESDERSAYGQLSFRNRKIEALGELEIRLKAVFDAPAAADQ
jgi:hypothetical protein